MTLETLQQRITDKLKEDDIEWIETEALPLVKEPMARLLILMLLLDARRQRRVFAKKPRAR